MTDHLDFGGDRRVVSFGGWHYSGATVLLAIAVYLAFRLSREALPVENPRLVDRLMGLTGLLVLISLAGGPSFFLLSGIGCFRAYGRAGLPALALWCVAAPVILHAALGRTRRGWVRPAAFVYLAWTDARGKLLDTPVPALFQHLYGPGMPAFSIKTPRSPGQCRLVVLDPKKRVIASRGYTLRRDLETGLQHIEADRSGFRTAATVLASARAGEHRTELVLENDSPYFIQASSSRDQVYLRSMRTHPLAMRQAPGSLSLQLRWIPEEKDRAAQVVDCPLPCDLSPGGRATMSLPRDVLSGDLRGRADRDRPAVLWASRATRGPDAGRTQGPHRSPDARLDRERITRAGRATMSVDIPKTDMFSEPFAVPNPETVVFVSTWEKGETLRSGLTWTIGKGRVAYLLTGPEGYPVLFHSSIRLAIANSVVWVGHRS